MTVLVVRVRDITGTVISERVAELAPAELSALDTKDTRTTGAVEVLLREERTVGRLDVPAGWFADDGR